MPEIPFDGPADQDEGQVGDGVKRELRWRRRLVNHHRRRFGFASPAGEEERGGERNPRAHRHTLLVGSPALHREGACRTATLLLGRRFGVVMTHHLAPETVLLYADGAPGAFGFSGAAFGTSGYSLSSIAYEDASAVDKKTRSGDP